MKSTSLIIRGIILGFILTELVFASWLVDPKVSPLTLFAKPVYAQELGSEGDSDPLDPNEAPGETAEPLLATLTDTLDALKNPITREGKLILDPRDAAILRAHLDPDQYTKNTSNVSAEDQATFNDFKQKLIELGFEGEQGVGAVLQDEVRRNQVLELVRETQTKIFTDRSRVALSSLERLIEQQREAIEVSDFLEGIVFASDLPGDQLVQKTKQNFPLDRRVVDALAWLITPRAQDGGGHERIKVARIWKNYTARDPKSGKPLREKTLSKETEGADNISLHAQGQAFDISEIETIKCSKVVVKKGIILRKVNRQKLPPKPIKVSYQTDQGVAQENPPGLSINDLTQNLIQNALLDTLSEFDVNDLGDDGSLRYANLQDMADFIGRHLIESAIGGRGLDGSSLGDTVELFGRAVLADRLGLPRQAIEGNTIDDIQYSVGRFTIEQRLGLPIGSLRGNNASEILTSVGRRKLESELGLKENTLQGTWNSRPALEEKIGEAMIETKMKLPAGSFAANDLTTLKRQLGERKIQIMFASSPSAIDELVGLPYGKTASDFLNGRVADYKRAIGSKLLNDNFGSFRNFVNSEQSQENSFYATPAGTIRRLLNGDQTVLAVIGRQALVNQLSPNDGDRSAINNFFENPSNDWQIPERTIMSLTKLRPGEFARIFSGQGAVPIFKRIGRDRLVQAIQNTTEVQQAINNREQELLAEHPEIAEARASYDFRRSRFDDLKNRNDNLDQLTRAATSDPAIRTEVNTIKSSLDQFFRSPLNFQNSANAVRQISRSLDAISSAVGPLNEQALRTQIQNELSAMYRDIEELVSGTPARQISDVRLADYSQTGKRGRSNNLIAARDLFDWLNGRRATKDLALSIGARQVENSLELPPRAIFYTLKEREQSPETFFRAVGRAQYEQYFGRQPIRVALAQNTPEQIDAILGIGTGRRSITSRLATQELTADQYFERVGKEVLLLRGVNLLGINVEFGGLSFTPYDIYDMLSGSGRPVFERVAAQKFEQVLDLPQSVFYQLLHAPSSDDKRLAMADVASHYFGNLLGIGALPIFGVPEEIQGRYAVEATLGLQPGTFRDSLDKVIERNQPINFAIAFRMTGHPNGLSLEGYDPGELGRAIETLSLPQSITTIGPQNAALAYLSRVNGNAISRDGAWRIIDQFRRGEVANEQKELTIEEVDEKLRLEIGATEKLLKGELSPANYAKKVGDFSIADTLARSTALIDRLADVLGLEGTARDNFNSQFPIVFDLLRRNSVTDVAAWRPQDRQSFYSALDTVFSIRFDSKLGVRTGTFSLIAAEPENARKVFLTEGVFKLENQFGLNDGVHDGPLSRVFNISFEADATRQPQVVRDAAENEFTLAARSEIFTRTQDRQGRGGIVMPDSDIQSLIHGDMRFLGFVAAADMAGSLNKDKNGNLLPPDRQITYEVIVNSLRAPADDESRLEAFREDAYNSALRFAEESGVTDEAQQRVLAQAQAAAETENERSRVRSQRKSEFQFRLIDNQLYKADINIPAGFARAMFEGTTQERTTSLLNYAENLINNHNILGIHLAQGSLDAARAYLRDSSGQNYDRLVQTGALGSLDQFVIQKKLFGDLWKPGTTQALFQYGRTGALGNLNTPGTIVGIYGQWAVSQAFQFLDSKMGWQVGNAAQIYFATQNFLHAKAAFAAAQSTFTLGNPAIQDAGSKLSDAYTLMITIVVTIVFAKQVGQMEQALGLVPGTGAILIGMGIAALMGAALNPITLGLFIALNLFGFNKVKIFVLCTGDGYYPQIEPLNPNLAIGLPEFNGMAATEYRAGLKQAARVRVNGLISDMMEMPYYFIDKNFVGVRQKEPDFSTKPVQIITARQQDLLAFFGSDRYKQVFNEDAPSKENRQGISISPLVTQHVHIGF
ncbi:MAG: hypothetical protein WAP74_02650 [Patescibacteria group bacterium]